MCDPRFFHEGKWSNFYGAGLTPYEALQTATSNAARFLGNSADEGTIAKGKIADMVLLTANPLQNIDNAFLQEGVMLRGKWYAEDELQRQLSGRLAASKAAAGQ